MHISNGNTTAAMKLSQCRDEIIRALVLDGNAPSASRFTYDKLKGTVGSDEVQRLARIPLRRRLRAVIVSCNRAKIDTSRLRTHAHQPPKPQQQQQHKQPKPKPQPSRQPPADAESRSPLQLRAVDWSVPVWNKPVADLPPDTVRAVAVVSIAEAKVAACALRGNLRGNEGAIALITRKPIPEVGESDTDSDGHPPAELPSQEIRVPFLTSTGTLLVLPRRITQLGNVPVSLKLAAAPPEPLPASHAETSFAALIQIWEEDLKKDVTRRIDAEGDAALYRCAEDWIKQHSVPDGGGQPPPIQAIFRSAKMRTQQGDCQPGKRSWSVIAKVKPTIVDRLRRYSGEEGITCCGADRNADKESFAVVPLPKDLNMATARAKLRSYPHCTHG
eukprot:gene1351-21993_t